MFILSALIHLVGCLFIIFCIDELKPNKVEEPKDKDGAENPGYSGSTLELQDRSPGQTTAAAELVEETHKGLKGVIMTIVNLFKSNFDIFKVNRIGGGRILLFLVTGAYVFLLLLTGNFLKLFLAYS